MDERKYEDALKRAKDLLDDMDKGDYFASKADIENIFPELKESKDERIRKTLIEYIKGIKSWNYFLGISKGQMIAWLEKQGEQKHFSDFKAKDWYVSKVDGKIYNMTYNPNDKVEPKFKIGDWITDGRLTCKVLSVTGKSYELHLHNDDYCHFETDVQSVDKRYHLWTIEDAKDGDVLAEDSCIFIIQNLNDNNTTAKTYCVLHDDGDFNYDSVLYFDIDSTKPATKEQRDLLFQKITEAGYEWDSEKKELNKIEQKTVDKTEPKFKVRDWILNDVCFPLQIASIRDGMYVFTEGDAISVSFVDEHLHLWTIQDAMDGDVLVGKDGHPFIFTGEFDVQDDNPTAYCGINSDDKFITGKGSHWTFKDGIKPATKEQRELLFAKMKEAGYEWDAEKKEVKKIEPKNPIVNVPPRELILSIWDLGNEWKELTNGCILPEYGTQLDYIQKHWYESEYYLKATQGNKSTEDVK